MEAAKCSVTSLIYRFDFSLVFKHLFWSIFSPLTQDRKFVVRTDYSSIYRLFVSPQFVLSPTVFGVSAGNRCRPRLQPNIHPSKRCLSPQIERIRVGLGSFEGLFKTVVQLVCS